MGCCRGGGRPASPAQTYDSPFCQKCNENLQALYVSTAAHQTRGSIGSSTVLVRVNCPKCNTVNLYRMNVQRNVQR